METRKRVLFICVHNSGRSQMAEAFLKAMGGRDVTVESAGLEPAERVLPIVVAVMQEEGFDLSGNRPQGVFNLFKAGRLYDYVITVCDESSESRCPIFPGIVKRLHWSFPDPAAVTGTEAERLEAVREIRDRIRDRIREELDNLLA